MFSERLRCSLQNCILEKCKPQSLFLRSCTQYFSDIVHNFWAKLLVGEAAASSKLLRVSYLRFWDSEPVQTRRLIGIRAVVLTSLSISWFPLPEEPDCWAVKKKHIWSVYLWGNLSNPTLGCHLGFSHLLLEERVGWGTAKVSGENNLEQFATMLQQVWRWFVTGVERGR